MDDRLTLPEEFALLSLGRSGKMLDPYQAQIGCALAELGETLSGKLLIGSGIDRTRPCGIS